MLTVVLAEATSESSIPSEIISDLQKTVPTINFIVCDSEEEARNLVIAKKADIAWIFDSDFDSRIEKAGKRGRILPVVTSVQGEDTVFLAYVREILCSKIFPYFSYAAYKAYILERMPSVTDKELFFQYSRFSSLPKLFNHQTEGIQNVSQSYLMSPLRGMLALWLLMCAFAATLYFMQDSQRGSFVWFNNNQSLFFFLKITFIPLFDCALIMFLAILTGGIFNSFLLEIFSLLLLVLSSILFANLLRIITVKNYIFCAAIPIIILVTLVLCPIFLKVNSFRPIQLLLPVFYYLNSVYSLYYLFLFSMYTIILFILNKILMTKY
jgi:ABC-2 type transport system permease protein